MSIRPPSLNNLLLGGGLATLIASALYAGYQYWYHKSTPLRYQVPSIWQHPSAELGAWDRALVIGSAKNKPGHYVIAAFQDGSDYVMNSGSSFDAARVNEIISHHITQGYRQLNFESYKGSYGMQDEQAVAGSAVCACPCDPPCPCPDPCPCAIADSDASDSDDEPAIDSIPAGSAI